MKIALRLFLFLLLLQYPAYAQIISRAEYFFDADPGPGNAVSIPVMNAGYHVLFDFTFPTATLSPGNHTLFIRTGTSNGTWSIPETRTITILPALVGAEYFIDSDPGQGNATAISILFSADSLAQTFNVTTSSLSAGQHQLFIRYKNQQGIWSLPELRSFTIKPAIVHCEYFVDSDPGAGNGFPVATAQADSIFINSLISTTSLSSGNHILFFRSKNQSGIWSLPEPRTFTVLPSLTASEYFIDADPGQGNGIAVSTTASDSITVSTIATTLSLSSGSHTLFFRTRNQSGIWSLPEPRTFIVQPSITAAEYFIDADPGTGNGNAVTVTQADSILFNTNFNTTSLSSGSHVLFIRTRNQSGSWSLPEIRTFIVTPAITAAEYFVDSDPGQGNGIAVSTTMADSVNLSSLLNTASLSNGIHYLFFRTRNQSGIWSLPELRTFTSNPALVAAEYFIDADPGHGNGTPVSISQLDSISLNRIIQTAFLSSGQHNLFFRTKSQSGTWSLPELRTFTILPTLVAAEYFVDADPGQGNAIPISLAFNSDSISLNFSIPTNAYTPGIHQLFCRTKNQQGIWSIPEISSFNVKPAIAATEYFVDIDPGAGSGTPVVINTLSDSVSKGFSISTTNLGPGIHRLFFRTRSNSGTWSLPEQRDITILPAINRAEYFVDTDPGAGAGIPVNFSPSDSATYNFVIPSTGLSLGTHRLYIRSSSTNGTWSIPEYRVFTISTEPGISLKLFLQGFYQGGGTMAAVLDPINRPTVCDSIQIALADGSPPYSILIEKSTVVNTNGSVLLDYPASLFGRSCYLIVKHRNSIQTWSKIPVTLNSDIIQFDFTTGAILVSGTVPGM